MRDGEALLGGDQSGAAAFAGERPEGDGLFVDLGANYYRVLVYLPPEVRYYRPRAGSPHLTIGARREVSAHQDIGVGLDVDSFSGRLLLGARMVDYRYRFDGPLAFHIFLGAARYSLATPAYGAYLGAGLQWRHVLPGLDVGLDYHDVISAQRVDDLPTEQPPGQESYHSIDSWTLYLSHSF